MTGLSFPLNQKPGCCAVSLLENPAHARTSSNIAWARTIMHHLLWQVHLFTNFKVCDLQLSCRTDWRCFCHVHELWKTLNPSPASIRWKCASIACRDQPRVSNKTVRKDRAEPVSNRSSEMLESVGFAQSHHHEDVRGFVPKWLLTIQCVLDFCRRPESACSSNNLMQNPNRSQNPKSEIQNPKSKIQNPKSKIQNPKSEIQNPKSKIQDPKSKIQNPKSKRPRLGLPQKERILRQSKIQNPKSKIQDPKSKIQDPKSKIQSPKSKIQNPKSKIEDPKSKIQNPRSKIQNPKSKVQNPNSKIQNPNGPGWGGYVANALVWMGWPPKFGVVGRDPSLQAKGRRLDSPRARLKLGPDFQMVISCVVETGGQFPENLWRVVVCQATILWAQLRERGQEKKEVKLDAAAFCCHARW